MQNSFRDRRKQKNIYSRKRRRIEMFYDAEKIVEFSVGRDYKKKTKKNSKNHKNLHWQRYIACF